MKKKELTCLLEQSKYRIKTYSKKIMEAEKSFRELNALNMQGTLIQFEDYLDNNHLYAFQNWLDGVIWDGPNVRRYWVDVTLKYPYKKMPDPRGAARLVNTGAKITYKKDVEVTAVDVKNADDLDPMTRKPKEKSVDVWLITILVPRRFIEDAIEDYQELEPSKAEAPAEEETTEEEAEGGEETEGLGGEEGGEEELEL